MMPSRREWTKEEITAEFSLLKMFLNKDIYNTYTKSLDHRRLMPSTALLLKDYEKYFSQYPQDNIIVLERFYSHFTQEWHRRDLDESDIEIYNNQIFPNIEQAPEDKMCLEFLIKEHTSNLIKDSLNRGLDTAHISSILEDYTKKLGDLSGDQEDKDIVTLDNVDFSVLDKTKGIPYFLPSLQAGLGSLVQGQFVVVAADYGAGKSAFVISQVAHTLKHMYERHDDRPILYFNSEGTPADVFGRVLSNLFRKTCTQGFEEICTSYPKYVGDAKEQYQAEKLKIIQIVTGDYNKIEQKIEKYKPCLVVIDIADVLASEENVFQLKKLYDSLRLLSAKYCPIIATTQSGSTTYQDKDDGYKTKHRKWLSERDLYGSKSGKGGAADTIIGIGKDDQHPEIRYINTPKKKRGTPVTVTCEIQERFSHYKELLDSSEDC